MDFRGQPEIVREYGLSGTEPVINQECMLVHEKSGRFVNLSGTAIMNLYLLPSQAYSLGRFFYTIIAEHPPCIHMIGSFAFGI